MKKLIITANPSSSGFTHKITDIYKKLSIQKWDEIEVIDLYKTDLKQDFLKYEDKHEIWKDETTKKIQAKISWSDELVFIFPIWWWDAPAILKNFMDSNFNSWFAFKYINWKAVWLLKWKSARVIATSWAPSFIIKVILHIQFMWWVARFWFCWISKKSFTIFWNMNTSKTDRNKYLKKINKLV